MFYHLAEEKQANKIENVWLGVLKLKMDFSFYINILTTNKWLPFYVHFIWN